MSSLSRFSDAPEASGSGAEDPATRCRLIEATIQSLAQRGYAGTSTVVVTRDAALSRGTLLHYFPSKAELLIAALREAVIRWGRAHKAALSTTVGPAEELSRLVDIGWDVMCSPAGLAWTELLIAARSERALERKVREVCARVDAKVKGAVWNAASQLGAPERPPIEASAQFYLSALRGLSADRIRPEAARDLDAAVAIVRECFIAQINRQLAEDRRIPL